jgi:hypothetical protein
MANPVTVADIEDRWRPLTAQETTNAEAYLTDAWWLLLGKLPDLETHVADGLVSQGNVTRVVVAMVLRIMKNPDGKLEESIDDYRYRRDSLVSAGELLVTLEELAALTPSGQRHNSVRLIAYGEV